MRVSCADRSNGIRHSAFALASVPLLPSHETSSFDRSCYLHYSEAERGFERTRIELGDICRQCQDTVVLEPGELGGQHRIAAIVADCETPAMQLAEGSPMLHRNVLPAQPFLKDVVDKRRFRVCQHIDLTEHVGAIESGEDRGYSFQLKPVLPFVVSTQRSRNPR